MSKRNRESRRARKKIIRRRRFLLLLVLLISIPILYGGSKFTINKIKGLYSTIVKGENSTGKGSTDTSSGEAVEEPVIRNVKILSAGDIMFHMPQVKSAYLGNGKYDFTGSFKHVEKYIGEADVAIANYVSVASGNDKKFSGVPHFNSPKETLRDIKEVGFDIVTTINNHSLDGGKSGLLSTLDYAEKYKLKTVGTYKKDQDKYLIEEKNGIRIGFLAYTDRLNDLEFYLSDEELSQMVNLIDEEKIKTDIEKLKEKTDIILVSIHWGEEYKREPDEKQLDLGHKMVDWGANIILGSGPQVVQKIETVRRAGSDNLIVYSMGNFLSNQREDSEGNAFPQDGVMLEIDIEKNMTSDSTFIRDVEVLPTWVNKYGESGKEEFQILPTFDALSGNIGIELDSSVLNRIEKSQEDSLEILNYR